MATARSMRNLPFDAEEDLNDLKKKIHLLEGDRKAFYETSQWTIRNYSETINAIRKENKELRSAIGAIQKQDSARVQAARSIDHDIQKLDQSVLELRSKYDELVKQRLDKDKEADALADKLKQLELEVESIEKGKKPQDSESARKIRDLENRLDKSIIKHNEAKSIKKTYEQILKRLQTERLSFDQQLAALEDALKAKEYDYKELLMMARDAHHAKEVARAELERFEKTLEEEHKKRQGDLSERRALVKAKMEMKDKMAGRGRQRDGRSGSGVEDDRKKLAEGYSTSAAMENGMLKAESEQQKMITTYEEAFRRIKDATGVSDVNTVIQKFLTQEETNTNLLELKERTQARIDQLREEKTSLRNKVEEIKYSASGGLGTRRMVDEFEDKLAEENNRCEKARQKYERLARVLINVKAGVQHLNSKLEHVKIDAPPVTLTDETIVEVLKRSEQRLLRLLTAINTAEGETDDLQRLVAQKAALVERPLPEYNVRIDLPKDSDSEDEAFDSEIRDDYDDENADGEVLDRRAMKNQADDIIERATKRPKKKKQSRLGTPGTPRTPRGANASLTVS